MPKPSQATATKRLAPHDPVEVSPGKAAAGDLDSAISITAADLVLALQGIVDDLAGDRPGPVALAKAAGAGVDKVLASRVLKALRAGDDYAALYAMPGPPPLRSLVRAAARRGASEPLTSRAMTAIDRLEALIARVGDRSLLDSILSAYLPDARAEFELRRKQTAFKAMSQLKGVQTDGILATCLLGPSDDADFIDVIWLHGLTGLHRVRPGVTVKISSRRMSAEPNARRAVAIDGREIDGTAAPLVPEFCSTPMPSIEVRRVGQSLFYVLGGDSFGAAAAVDVAFAEINRAELRRPVTAPSPRSVYFFAEAMVPAKSMQFDLIMHRDLFPRVEPVLRLHDTALEGVADPMDESRELDRLDMLESITSLGTGLTSIRSPLAAWYSALLHRTLETMRWDASAMRSYRCAIEYPLYGTQVSMLLPAI